MIQTRRIEHAGWDLRSFPGRCAQRATTPAIKRRRLTHDRCLDQAPAKTRHQKLSQAATCTIYDAENRQRAYPSR